MPTINYKTVDFPKRYQLPNKIHTLSCSWPDIILAAITVGRKGRNEVIKNGILSEREMAFRINMILAFFEENSQGKIVRTNNFINLDPSEKVAISYFLGLVGTKLIAEKVFGISWLMHLDVYTKHANSHDKVFLKKWNKDRNTRPDLIGIDKRRDWVVIEAKGRTNNITKKDMLKAKEQTRNIKTINGQYPVLRFVNSTYFSRNVWSFSLVDPEEYQEKAPDIKITPGQFLNDYYSPINEFLRGEITEEIKYEDNFYIVRKISGTNVKIGVESKIHNILQEKTYSNQVFENAIYNAIPIKSEIIDPFNDKSDSTERDFNKVNKTREDKANLESIDMERKKSKNRSHISSGSDRIIIIYDEN